MPAAFWRALDRLGALGAAASDWRRMLGTDWEKSRRFLRELPVPADSVTHPLDATIRLAVEPEGADGFVAVRDDGPPTDDAYRLEEDDVARLAPDWDALARTLGEWLGFAPRPGSRRSAGRARRRRPA